MTIFLDTSSLFKLYVLENGSDELDDLFEQQLIDQIYLSELTLIEFRSIVWRKVRMNQISIEEAQLLVDAFDKDCVSYQFISITDLLIQSASQLLDKHGVKGLRSLDSIQLAAALSIRQNAQLFKTADTLLYDLFVIEGLHTTPQ